MNFNATAEPGIRSLRKRYIAIGFIVLLMVVAGGSVVGGLSFVSGTHQPLTQDGLAGILVAALLPAGIMLVPIGYLVYEWHKKHVATHPPQPDLIHYTQCTVRPRPVDDGDNAGIREPPAAHQAQHLHPPPPNRHADYDRPAAAFPPPRMPQGFAGHKSSPQRRPENIPLRERPPMRAYYAHVEDAVDTPGLPKESVRRAAVRSEGPLSDPSGGPNTGYGLLPRPAKASGVGIADTMGRRGEGEGRERSYAGHPAGGGRATVDDMRGVRHAPSVASSLGRSLTDRPFSRVSAVSSCTSIAPSVEDSAVSGNSEAGRSAETILTLPDLEGTAVDGDAERYWRDEYGNGVKRFTDGVSTSAAPAVVLRS